MTIEKGQSGNPGGRPKVVAEVKELARARTGDAIETLVSIMSNPKAAPALILGKEKGDREAVGASSCCSRNPPNQRLVKC